MQQYTDLVVVVVAETFEGLGLGTRIALLKFSSNSTVCGIHVPRTVKPLLMAFAYGLTTPIGQAIGLALLLSPGTTYDPASRSALILVGTMNALSAGLLLWASLVELLAAGTYPPPPPLLLPAPFIPRARLHAHNLTTTLVLCLVRSCRLLRRRAHDRHHGQRPRMAHRGVHMRSPGCHGDGYCRSMGVVGPPVPCSSIPQ